MRKLALAIGLTLSVFGCAHKGAGKRAAPARADRNENARARSTPSSLGNSRPEPLVFSSLGTIWTVEFGETPPKSIDSTLKEKILAAPTEIERTFSDTLADSELRRLERDGLVRTQHPSPLFLVGLYLAREASRLTDGSFDITIGALQFKELTVPVGMNELVLTKESFRFKKDPKRLTFGGLMKGAAAGKIALVLNQHGMKNFRVTAGEGNLLIAGKNFESAWSEFAPAKDEMIFVARSRSKKNGVQRVFDPDAPSRQLERRSEIVCSAPMTKPAGWFRASTLTDALSTASLIKPDFSGVPPTCRIKVSQESN